jgi:hypothetical protein
MSLKQTFGFRAIKDAWWPFAFYMAGIEEEDHEQQG